MSWSTELAEPDPDFATEAEGDLVSCEPRPRYGRFALWIASASSLAVGVVGTVGYGVWFHHDQGVYVDALASARQALGPTDPASAAPTAVRAGTVTQAPAVDTAEAGDSTSAQPASADQPPAAVSRDSAQSPVVSPSPTQASRASAQARTGSANSHSKASRSPFMRIAWFFHHAGSRRHGSRTRSEIYTRP